MPRKDLTTQLFVPSRFALYYLKITKCASTFMTNLMWQLEEGAAPDPETGERAVRNDLPRGKGVPVIQVRRSPYAFVVLRNPVDRFISLYFDKFQSDDGTTRLWGPVRKVLASRLDTFDAAATTVDAHRRNAALALDAIAESLGPRPDLANPHWLPQARRVERIARPLRMRALTMDDLNDQLLHLLTPLVPDIADRLAAIRAHNRSPRPVSSGDVLTDELKARIEALYAEDLALWTWANRHWEESRGADGKATSLARLTPKNRLSADED